jgi:CheY-like chemotaxis protein
MTAKEHSVKSVFMLEDDEDDRYITKTFLDDANKNVPIMYFTTSEEMFEQLDSGKIPSIILVDYNFGPRTAIDVLKLLKSHKEYSSIPVVVLSDNAMPQFIRESYAYGACSFIQKPDNVEDTRNKLKHFFHYWTEVSETIDSNIFQ